jgi:hypothetical protein
MVVDEMTDSDFVELLRRWHEDHTHALAARGANVSFGDCPDSAGSDPVAWLDMFRGTRGGRIALWRDDQVELELADVETGEVRPEHFTMESGEQMEALLRRLTVWSGIEERTTE